ncbi:hypothetical protein [Xenorhabdus szentirmaii]|uniref:Secreted protein n=2 Tax=Xenorhabdus szentirmaii TaxID=290112 RepID=W1J1W5_9GAMM|nr:MULTISPECIES: hypothetical protein [Xenorhabdus]MBD2781731.1 hypothetical protein [Xenorhabdus sp. 38]MBD2793335.1 hypothetical protein [Xenorhabdus sp. CUL]MBD2801907.1 hypothetical protein [Xenorhabdus sp. M]MBD2805177.1 hypothetical protein [Xenorhabdus sp. ZM]MBD2820116.1 hypothetical protein [Xenorhabdus sp. 42]
MKIINILFCSALYCLLISPVWADEKMVDADKQQILSADYNMEFKNHSSSVNNLVIVKQSSNCMYDSGADQISINPGNKQATHLEDNDNLFSACTLRAKWVEWSVSYDSMSCALRFERGYDFSDLGWYTVIKGCPDIVQSATCGNADCNQTKVYGSSSYMDINVEFLVQ